MNFTASISGGVELQRSLQNLGPVPARKLGIRALTDGAAIIIKYAKSLAPVSDVPERHLRDSIVSVPGAISDKGCTVKIGILEPAARHAGFVEFGTHKMAAEPFMRPALDSTGQDVIDAIILSLRTGIENETKTPGGSASALALGAFEDLAIVIGAVL
jgi:HK97 gp10 family phage protein